MEGTDRLVELELTKRARKGTLHEFISREINPLLAQGWTVSDLKIEGKTSGRRRSIRIAVKLSGADEAAQAPIWQ